MRKLPDRDHNLIASALWISVGPIKILLGSDVENGVSNQTGWRGVISNSGTPDMKVQVIKVSHHGSNNAHYTPSWNLHTQGNPVAVITPFSKSNPPLPTRSDIDRIKRFSRRVGLTASVKFEDPDRYYSKEVTKRIGRMTKKWSVKRFEKDIGFLRLRYNLDGILTEETAIHPSKWV